MGAYQDIMGDLHNLFGRVNEVHVFLDETEPGGYYIEEVIKGNNISGVFRGFNTVRPTWKRRSKNRSTPKFAKDVIKPREGVELQNFYEEVLHGYTYVDQKSRPNS